ncbi:unnamed protein product [Schistocephalus solidus]|uniref:Uncharacterized protein n=1 Tax=Schistocephalus solidus TaxID=70667 RepID=A0A183TUA2_SCHSO|nr:unnamed protein product [Schistocephalus solidus]
MGPRIAGDPDYCDGLLLELIRVKYAVQSWTDQGSRRDHYWNEATIRNSLTEEYSHQLQLHHHNHHQHHHQQSQHSQSAFTRRVTVSSCVAGDATIIANTHLTQSVPNATTVEFGFGGVGQPWRRTDAVLVYQLEPPPTLQAIVREKIVQASFLSRPLGFAELISRSLCLSFSLLLFGLHHLKRPFSFFLVLFSSSSSSHSLPPKLALF